MADDDTIQELPSSIAGLGATMDALKAKAYPAADLNRVQRDRLNGRRWDQAHGHAMRGLDETPDHGGTTPGLTLSDISRLADEAERLRARVAELEAM